MQILNASVTDPFTDRDVIQMLKETLVDRTEDALAREIGLAAQSMQDEPPVAYGLWPHELRQMALWAARFAVRLLDRRCRRDARLHATVALARHRYNLSILALEPRQILSCYFDAKIVLDQEWARMTDRDFWHLDGDTRARIIQAAELSAEREF